MNYRKRKVEIRRPFAVILFCVVALLTLGTIAALVPSPIQAAIVAIAVLRISIPIVTFVIYLRGLSQEVEMGNFHKGNWGFLYLFLISLINILLCNFAIEYLVSFQ